MVFWSCLAPPRLFASLLAFFNEVTMQEDFLSNRSAELFKYFMVRLQNLLPLILGKTTIRPYGYSSKIRKQRVIWAFFLIMGFLLLVVVGGRFLGYLEEASLGSLSGTLAVMFIVYRLPEFLQIVAPFAMFFAVLLTFGRLYAESEMVIFHASGVGIRQVGSWLCGPFWASVCSWHRCRYNLTPKCSHLLDELLTEQRKISTFDLINPGNFLTLKQGDYTIYSEGVSADDGVLTNIFIFEKTRINDEIAFWAEKSEIVVNEEAKDQVSSVTKRLQISREPWASRLPGD